MLLYENPRADVVDSRRRRRAGRRRSVGSGPALCAGQRRFDPSRRHRRRIGGSLGDALFDAILAAPHGLTFTVDDYDETIRRLETPDKRVSLASPALLDELDTLSAPLSPATLAASIDYPFVLARLERV